jgi:hypothetical protein
VEKKSDNHVHGPLGEIRRFECFSHIHLRVSRDSAWPSGRVRDQIGSAFSRTGGSMLLRGLGPNLDFAIFWTHCLELDPNQIRAVSYLRSSRGPSLNQGLRLSEAQSRCGQSRAARAAPLSRADAVGRTRWLSARSVTQTMPRRGARQVHHDRTGRRGGLRGRLDRGSTSVDVLRRRGGEQNRKSR